VEKKTSFRSFDSIRSKKKIAPIKHAAKPKKSSHKNWSWLILLLVPVFVFLSLLCVSKVVDKVKVAQMFRSGRYLVLFQNNAELRPSGGFIGSFAVIEFRNFTIKKIDFNSNITKLDKAYVADHSVPAPAPLGQIASGNWAMRDSNFAVSFPEAAQKVEWFYSQETGDSVDGVISINASVLRDFLKITGPMTLSDPAVTIDSGNFFTELTNQIENEYFDSTENQQTNEPKEILKTMMPEVLKRALSINKIKLYEFVYVSFKEKQIQFFSNDPAIEQSIKDLGLGGEVKDFDKDYLQVNVANIGGSKSSQNINENLEYEVINQNGLMMSDLTITRKHIGTGVWPDGVNRSWVKVLVPKNTILKSADLDGSDITAKVESGEEAGKTYFASWVITKPQTTSVLHLNYQLPISPENYAVLLQKQSGNCGDLVRVLLNNNLLYNGVLNSDTVVK